MGGKTEPFLRTGGWDGTVWGNSWPMFPEKGPNRSPKAGGGVSCGRQAGSPPAHSAPSNARCVTCALVIPVCAVEGSSGPQQAARTRSAKQRAALRVCVVRACGGRQQRAPATCEAPSNLCVRVVVDGNSGPQQAARTRSAKHRAALRVRVCGACLWWKAAAGPSRRPAHEAPSNARRFV